MGRREFLGGRQDIFRPKDSALTSWGVTLLFFSSCINSEHWINLKFSCDINSSVYAAWILTIWAIVWEGNGVSCQSVFKSSNWRYFNSEALSSRFLVRIDESLDFPVRSWCMFLSVALFFSVCWFCRNELNKTKSLLAVILEVDQCTKFIIENQNRSL